MPSLMIPSPAGAQAHPYTYVTYIWTGSDHGLRRTSALPSHERGAVVKFCAVCLIAFDVCFSDKSINRCRRGVVLTSNDVGIVRVGIDSCWRGKTNENENGQSDESE